MPVLERDVVLMGRDGGSDTIDLPITCLKNIEDTADIKETPAVEDYLPIVDSTDGGQMKKTPFSAILDPLAAVKQTADGAVPATRKINQKSLGADITLTAADVGAVTAQQVNAAIQAAVLDSWEGSY